MVRNDLTLFCSLSLLTMSFSFGCGGGNSSPTSPSNPPTFTPVPTNTLVATGTFTRFNSPTSTATATPDLTSTVTPSFTSTATSTATSTVASTFSSTNSWTTTPTSTYSVTSTFTITQTPTRSPTFTSSPTETMTTTQTVTNTATSTFTATYSPTFSFTPTVTDTYTVALTPLCAPMTAFGNTSSTSATSVAPGFAWCMPITLTSSAIVTAYNLNMNETSSFYSLQMGIYSDNGGAPWTLLASTGTQATVNGWGTLWLTNPVNLSGNGAVYWIVSLVTGGVGMNANSSYVPSGSLLGTGTYSTLPASLTGAYNNGSNTNQPSVYLNGCLIGGPPTSTWTPTVTSTPTATITFTPTVTLTAQPTPACSPFTTMGNILGTFPAGYQVQYVFAIPITLLSSDESAYSMAVDCIGVTSPIRLGIYDDNGGAPNNLLAETDYSASMSVGSYTTLPLLNPVFLNGGGKVYWLAYFYSYGTYGNPENMYEQGIAGVKSSGIYGDLPSSLAGQTTSYPVIASIYMNVCP